MEPVGLAVDDQIDRLVIHLRAYAEARIKATPQPRPWRGGPVVVFDTETTTDPSQRLRFGAYQVRQDGGLIERGLFHAEDLPPEDIAVLRGVIAAEVPTDDGEAIRLLTRAEFVDHVLFGWGWELGGLVVGFNLPFDLSRVAEGYTYAKGRMKGGFSFEMGKDRQNIRVKAHSQRAAFFDVARKRGDIGTADRGFFVDVKTLAATLTSQSHSLASLAGLLGTTPKGEVDGFDGPLTPEFVRYGMNDVQVTWECFAKLADQYNAYDLKAGLHELYSEASLGKAFLDAMGVKPFRTVQPDFPPAVLGQIMSAYYGGRAEVHIRRRITPVIHCDFLSMYPTVCTLMGLWRFVIAKGVTWADATDEVRQFVDDCSLDNLRTPERWRDLTCIVQVLPDDDIFPVRARYDRDQAATIGLNRLTSREPLWFTLADVLASKILTGKAPKIISALRFAPGEYQDRLQPIILAGDQIHPAKHDFYRHLIIRRRAIQKRAKAASGAYKATLETDAQSLKILANSTSYGIFVELNVQRTDKPKSVTVYGHRGVGRTVRTHTVEEPGRYFHPLLATLITGAARLMLALAERNALDQGLDWAFCDTDSLAIANPTDLPEQAFIRRVEEVRRWFEPLNPYEEAGSILQLEKVNFPTGSAQQADDLRPVNCLAVSAKRYVLFERDRHGEPIVRKASAHGLGHLIAPYPDPERGTRIGRIGVELWQEDFWRQIITAFDRGEPDEVDFGALRNFDQPAASRYAATNQTLLGWFNSYNKAMAPDERVRPFNFLLSFQAKSRMEMAALNPEDVAALARRKRQFTPASRYSSDLIGDRPPVFDRRTGAPIPWEWLKTYNRSLVRHHLHAETKFLGGADNACGVLRRRHVQVWAVRPIGKEADNLEVREIIGEDDDAIVWDLANGDLARMVADIRQALIADEIGVNELSRAARVSHHVVTALHRGGRAPPEAVLSMAEGLEELRRERWDIEAHHAGVMAQLEAIVMSVGSVSKAAALLDITRQYLGRVIRGERPMTEALAERIGSRRGS